MEFRIDIILRWRLKMDCPPGPWACTYSPWPSSMPTSRSNSSSASSGSSRPPSSSSLPRPTTSSNPTPASKEPSISSPTPSSSASYSPSPGWPRTKEASPGTISTPINGWSNTEGASCCWPWPWPPSFSTLLLTTGTKEPVLSSSRC